LPGIGQSSFTEEILMTSPGGIEDRGAHLDAGIVDDDVESAEGVDGSRDQPA
jgi:hypothetical protein